MTLSNVLLKSIYASYYRQLSFVIIMNTHRYNRINRGVATNNGLGESRLKLRPYLYPKYKRGIKESNVYLSC